eukprot:3351585-Lingulodinium_polyedra.AAC.1
MATTAATTVVKAMAAVGTATQMTVTAARTRPNAEAVAKTWATTVAVCLWLVATPQATANDCSCCGYNWG